MKNLMPSGLVASLAIFASVASTAALADYEQQVKRQRSIAKIWLWTNTKRIRMKVALPEMPLAETFKWRSLKTSNLLEEAKFLNNQARRLLPGQRFYWQIQLWTTGNPRSRISASVSTSRPLKFRNATSGGTELPTLNMVSRNLSQVFLS